MQCTQGRGKLRQGRPQAPLDLTDLATTLKAGLASIRASLDKIQPIHASYELHCEHPAKSVPDQFIQSNQVRVSQARKAAEFTLEIPKACRFCLAQNLQGNGLVSLLVYYLVDIAESPGSYFGHDLKAAIPQFFQA